MNRRLFRQINRVMVPLLRHGFARIAANPLTGYMLVLQTTGRKSQQPRYTPLNYAIDQGNVYCLAGFGATSDWVANLRTNPLVKLRLPDRWVTGSAHEVQDAAVQRRLSVQVARNSGLAIAFDDPTSLWMSDAQLAEHFANRPLIQIAPLGAPVTPGAFDPGGRGWLLSWLLHALVVMVLIRNRRKHSAAFIFP